MRYYLAFYCGGCEATVYLPCVTLLERGGTPVVPASVVEQESFTCDECGALNHTGDLEGYVESDVTGNDGDEETDDDE